MIEWKGEPLWYHREVSGKQHLEEEESPSFFKQWACHDSKALFILQYGMSNLWHED